MSYPPNPPEGYPSAGAPQPGQGEPAAPYQPTPYQPPQYTQPPQQPAQYPGAEMPSADEQQPTPPFPSGQPTAIVYPQQTSPPPPPPAYQQGTAPIPAYQPPAFGDTYPAGIPQQPSGPPTMSGPPAMDPMSGPPGYLPPYSGIPDYGQAAPKPKRGAIVPILAALTVLFFLATAVLTGLYITKNGAFDKKVADLKARDTTISSQDGQIKDLQTKLQAAKDQLDAAGQKQSGTQSQLDETIKEKQVIGNCLTLLTEALTAAANGDRATMDAKFKQADQPCTEAGKYLN